MPKADVRQPILDIELALTDAKDYQLESALQQFNSFKKEAVTNLTEDMIKSCIRGITIEMHRRVAEKHYQEHYQDSLIVSDEHTLAQ